MIEINKGLLTVKDQLKQLYEELENAHQRFDYATDDSLIDAAIFDINKINLQIKYLNDQLKKDFYEKECLPE